MKHHERQALYAEACNVSTKPATEVEKRLAGATLELLSHTMDMLSMLQFVRQFGVSETTEQNIDRLIAKVEG